MSEITVDKSKIALFQYLQETKERGGVFNDDLVALFNPLFKRLKTIHEAGMIANIHDVQNLFVINHEIYFDETKIEDPKLNVEKLLSITDKGTSVFHITDHVRSTTTAGSGEVDYKSDIIHYDKDSIITKPVYVSGYGSFEQEIGHYDQKTELFMCGLLMASFAFNLDFNIQEEFEKFVEYRKRFYFLNKQIHPTILQIIEQLTTLDREKRTRETSQLIWKLNNYKDYNYESEEDLTESEAFRSQDLSSRSSWVLSKLKSRLFELSRRNKLLHFKSSSRFLNLTVASVPSVLYHENIREKDLFLWHSELATKIKSQDKIKLSRYLQFDEAGYISSGLDKIRTEARKDIYEYGFSQLKLVVAFLNWYNFKEDKSEKIISPLLIIPVSLVKQKGVNDEYVLQSTSSEAEINPVLVHQLKELYDVDLPHFIDLDKLNIEELYESIRRRIEQQNHEVKVVLQAKPRLKLIQSIAKQKITQHQKNTRYTTQEFNTSQFNYSYKRDGYSPLGCQIFKEYIRPHSSVLEYLINDDIKLDYNAFSAEKKRTFYSTDDGNINPYEWEFDLCNITIGNFNYKKMSLVSDYLSILNDKVENRVFENLFSDDPKPIPEKEDSSSYEENYFVLNADATQSKAVSKAREGKSYIIQGPPGTGKSQTITNLIADYASRGKRVLFVCEKRAALDVVYARLKQNNLHYLSCLIHDSQTDKKEFIMDAKATYEKFVEEACNYTELAAKRDQIITTIKKELLSINHFHETLNKTFEHIGLSLIQFLENLLELESRVEDKTVNLKFDIPQYAQWKASERVLKELTQALNSLGYSPILGRYSLLNLDSEQLSGGKNDALSGTIADLQDKINEWEELSDIYDFQQIFGYNLDKISALTSYATIVYGLIRNGKQSLLQGDTQEEERFNQFISDYNQTLSGLEKYKNENRHWKNKLDAKDAQAAHAILQKFEGKFYAFILPSFKRVKKLIQANYDLSQHKVNPKLTSVTDNLINEYEQFNRLEKSKEEIERAYGFSDIENGKSRICALIDQDKSYSEELLKMNQDAVRALDSLQLEVKQFINDYRKLKGKWNTDELSDIRELLSAMENDLKTLPVVQPYLQNFNQLDGEVKRFISNSLYDLQTNEKITADKALQDLYKQDISVVNANGYRLHYAVQNIQRLHAELLELNAELLIEKYKSEFKRQLHNSSLLAKEQNENEKYEKLAFNKARKILENEFNKSIRFKSIRELTTSDSSYLLDLIKPVWLMSPLSVSDTLPIDSNLFDVVIFDEASQITLEEGVPTLFRSNQAIIVGDEMQMPPTNFFSSGPSIKEEDIDEYGQDRIAIDANSMLTHATQKLEGVMLAWHYRSRYEGLIGFSNAAFYQGNLLTIPDREIVGFGSASTNKDVPLYKVNNEVISYHFLEDGVYNKRRNLHEAQYIAEMLKDILLHNPNDSIGIVAFSMEQQTTIESALDDLSRKDNNFAQLLEEAYNRVEDGQQVGLFVKNLENVQGDERDIMIISVCYGYNEKGKMLMNFGPINRKGGEKRLNVIFSRAKKHMAIVASITHTDIKNEYNEGANYLKRFLQYAQSLSEGRFDESSGLLNHLKSASTKTNLNENFDPVISEIRSYLSENGYQSETEIGLSDFKLSIGVKNPENQSQYILGILVDNSTFYQRSDIMDLYVLRPYLLKTFGWKNITVNKKDWTENRDLVKDYILRSLKADENIYVEDDVPVKSEIALVDDPKGSEPLEIVEISPETNIKAANKSSSSNMTYLELSDGKSNKFWEVKGVKTDLIIRFGRIGTDGRSITKSYANEEDAQKDKDKMLKEKLAKGYVKK